MATAKKDTELRFKRVTVSTEETVVTIKLDSNEAAAVRYFLGQHYKAERTAAGYTDQSNTVDGALARVEEGELDEGSLKAAGARVLRALGSLRDDGMWSE